MRRLFPFMLLPLIWTTDTTPAAESIADPGFLEQYASTYRFRLGRPTAIRPTPDGKSVLFLRSGPRDFVRDLYELDVESGEERVLLTAAQLLDGAAERLTAEEKARRERQRKVARGIADYHLSRDGKQILVPLSGRLFLLNRSSGAVRELAPGSPPAIDPRLSPDGSRIACVREAELHVIDTTTGQDRRLTDGAGGTLTHGTAEFVAQEEMSRHHGFWWSPDSTVIVYQETDTAGLEVMNIMDATHPEKPPQSWPYPRPGKRNASVRLGIIPVAGGETTWIAWDREAHEYLTTVKWADDAPLTLVVQNRKQTVSRVLEVDPRDGSTRTLLVEEDPAWVEIDQAMPRWLPGGKQFLWTTEREGALQLELRGRDGTRIAALTEPDFGMQGFVDVPGSAGVAVVRASDDPTGTQIYRVELDPQAGGPQRITKASGSHSMQYNRKGTLAVHTFETKDGELRWNVLDGAGKRRASLTSLAESPPFRPQVELTTVGNDRRFHAALVRPRNFDRSSSYPVIVHVYGGPTSQMVRRGTSRYLFDQWMADHGFVVVRIDGRGTPHRGRDWQRSVNLDLIRLPLSDQASALRMLGAKYKELDLDRVGIYGWSFGGYFSAMAVMRMPDVFHAAVAGAPVTDWRDYDTHYTERYMDLPQHNAKGYEETSVMTYADRLERPLLLIHGTADDNVYFMHSLKLADALFREGKKFEFLPLPGFTHMVPDPLVTRRLYSRIMDFFGGNLGRPRPAAGASR